MSAWQTPPDRYTRLRPAPPPPAGRDPAIGALAVACFLAAFVLLAVLI